MNQTASNSGVAPSKLSKAVGAPCGLFLHAQKYLQLTARDNMSHLLNSNIQNKHFIVLFKETCRNRSGADSAFYDNQISFCREN
ncbi:hypothetical protein SAMN04488056_106171 [Cohaesibacter marisflavi]|uniref:Uncharacterized protein n=1 Tax=Cohaesibacter marisflavi TaxID=655353 RepID=A0A1I5HDF3_9HYPH|nr:hypothetical protein SAMN04488056_106171 [Cohaesibacter marisflavi]